MKHGPYDPIPTRPRLIGVGMRSYGPWLGWRQPASHHWYTRFDRQLNVQLCCTDNVHNNVDTYIYSSCRLLVGGYMKEYLYRRICRRNLRGRRTGMTWCESVRCKLLHCDRDSEHKTVLRTHTHTHTQRQAQCQFKHFATYACAISRNAFVDAWRTCVVLLVSTCMAVKLYDV